MPGDRPDPVIVVGGGIGGLAAALAIRSAGREVVVLEAEGEGREVGAGISLWPNAMAALDRLGVGAQVRGHSVEVPDTVVRLAGGRVLSRLPRDRVVAALGEPARVIHRAELLGVLAGAVGTGPLRHHSGVVAIEDHDDGTASVTTATGETLHGAGVVGADGVASVVREWMHPATAPTYAGWTAWRGIATVSAEEMGPPPCAETWDGRGRRFGALPLPGGRVYWYATANRPEGERHADPAAEHAALSHELRRWPVPVPALLAATDPDTVLRNDVFDLEPLPTWVRGGVCLLGDAAHPMQPNLGQGACQALEDAEVLGACLRAETAAASAFARYETVRKRQADAVVALSRRLGRIAQHGGAFGSMRDLGTRLTPTALTLRRLKRFAAGAPRPDRRRGSS